MKNFIWILLIFVFQFSNIIFAEQKNNENYEQSNIIGLSFNNAIYDDNNNIGYLEISDQLNYRLKDFPIIPYLEANINIGLTDKSPNSIIGVLFGIKKYLIEVENGFLFSMDMGTGMAVGSVKDSNGVYGIIGKIGFNVGYDKFSLRYGTSILTGFPFQGNFFVGLNYAF